MPDELALEELTDDICLLGHVIAEVNDLDVVTLEEVDDILGLHVS